jgi:hypothetical protein
MNRYQKNINKGSKEAIRDSIYSYKKLEEFSESNMNYL